MEPYKKSVFAAPKSLRSPEQTRALNQEKPLTQDALIVEVKVRFLGIDCCLNGRIWFSVPTAHVPFNPLQKTSIIYQSSSASWVIKVRTDLSDRVLNLLDRTHSRENVIAFDLNLAFECLFVHPFDALSFLAERRFVKGPQQVDRSRWVDWLIIVWICSIEQRKVEREIDREIDRELLTFVEFAMIVFFLPSIDPVSFLADCSPICLVNKLRD